MDDKIKYLEFNKDILYFYSTYNMFRGISKQIILEQTIYPNLSGVDISIFTIEIKGFKHFFYVKYLKWDSEFNGFPTYKLLMCLYIHKDISILTRAVKEFKTVFFTDNRYCFIEIPSEDILFVQALNFNGFRLIETRLNHYIENLDNYKFERFPVRLADKEDIPSLRKVASNTINLYDRLHADVFIKPELANKYLATYIENAVNGFSDAVIVPNIKTEKAKGFMTLSLLKKDSKRLNRNIGRLQLSAIDKSLKGWYIKLASEATYYAKEKGIRSMLVTTQVTNRAAFHSSEKQGFKLGSVTHVLTYSNIRKL
jgi:dTDP-4-amino-4,6-dideoxy-D-galactose acyltransferase